MMFCLTTLKSNIGISHRGTSVADHTTEAIMKQTTKRKNTRDVRVVMDTDTEPNRNTGNPVSV